jgi:hypothetical protein
VMILGVKPSGFRVDTCSAAVRRLVVSDWPVLQQMGSAV